MHDYQFSVVQIDH